jgi:hypothetical protein
LESKILTTKKNMQSMQDTKFSRIILCQEQWLWICVFETERTSKGKARPSVVRASWWLCWHKADMRTRGRCQHVSNLSNNPLQLAAAGNAELEHDVAWAWAGFGS